MMETKFRWKRERQLKEGYGNRNSLICNDCNKTVFTFDFGNNTGLRYGMIEAEQIALKHLLEQHTKPQEGL